jgi:hypothetical protein
MALQNAIAAAAEMARYWDQDRQNLLLENQGTSPKTLARLTRLDGYAALRPVCGLERVTNTNASLCVRSAIAHAAWKLSKITWNYK